MKRTLLASGAALALVLVGCAAQPTATPSPTVAGPTAPGATQTPVVSPTPGETASLEPVESGGTTTGGDIPDNAIFLTYTDSTNAFSIQYVEGWQVTPQSDGVVIRDKDSSEAVQVVAGVTDIPSYISNTDLPALQATPSFSLETQDTVDVNGQQLNHLLYKSVSPPDPVTGKQVPSLVDRYYVPGANGIAIVTLSTPTGVDNVDAFRTMIESLTWL